jgi:probable rRNA maturation factor
MIILDPDLDPASLHGRRPVHGDSDPVAKTDSPGRTVVRARAGKAPIKKSNEIDLPTARTLSRYLKMAQDAVGLKGEVTVLLTTDEAIRGLNRRFRGKNKATDVLSFPAMDQQASRSASQRGSKAASQQVSGSADERVAGDLAISVTTAVRQANEQGHALWTEIKVLMLHGLLHLAGLDHEVDDGKMARRELKLRAKLQLPQGLIERAGAPALSPKGWRKDGAPKSLARSAKKPAENVPQGLKPKQTPRSKSARLKSSPFKAAAKAKRA